MHISHYFYSIPSLPFFFFLLTENSPRAKLFLYPCILKIWIIPCNPDLFTSDKLNIFVKQMKSSLVGTLSLNHHSSSRPNNPFPFHHIPQIHVKRRVPWPHMNKDALLNKPLAVQLYKCLGQWSLTAWLSDNGPFKKTFLLVLRYINKQTNRFAFFTYLRLILRDTHHLLPTSKQVTLGRIT